MVLENYLKLLGYKVVLCMDGVEGLNAFKKHYFDLCILDVMMPKKDGFALVEDIRELNAVVPIIFFTAKLRKHLKDDPSISIINVHGSGFKLEISED